nr:GNAT family protein [Alteribacter salitolerans]
MDFEKVNRMFFDEIIPKRSDSDYDREPFEDTLSSFLQEIEQEKCFMFVVRKTEDKRIVGRVNLVNVNVSEDGVKKAEIGYRIGQKYKGKGYATLAVQLASRIAAAKDINLITAVTFTDNISSQVVLLKNGFHEAGLKKNALEFHGEWLDSIQFEKRLSKLSS